MILGSVLGSFLYTKKKYGDEWKSRFLKCLLMDLVFTAIVGEFISRFVLHHDSSFPILMMKVRSFGIKYYFLLFIMAVILPFGIGILSAVFKKTISVVKVIANKIPTDKEIFASPRKEKVFVFALAIVLFSGILMGTRVIWSGYHFMDDHRIIDIIGMKEQDSLFRIMFRFIRTDISGRFRPLYWICYTTKAYLFGLHITAWMFVAMAEGIATFILLYYFAKNLQLTQFESLLFALLSTLGPQFEPWYRISFQEEEGYLLIALILYVISKLYFEKGGDTKIWEKTMLCILVTLCSCQKEAFVLMSPAWLLLIMAIYRMSGNTCPFRQLLSKEKYVIAYQLLLFLVEIVFILLYVGTDDEYAGFSQSVTIGEYLDGIWRSMMDVLRYHFVFLIVICAFIMIGMTRKGVNIELSGRKYVWLIVCAIYIMTSQLVLHARSTMLPRYTIPFVTGFFLLTAVFVPIFFRERKVLYMMMSLTQICLILVCLVVSIRGARFWAGRGEDIHELLYDLKSELEQRDEASIMVNIRNYEEELSVVKWEEYYTGKQWDWTCCETMYYRRRMDEVKPRAYDYIVSHYANYYSTEMLQNDFYIDRNDYEEIATIKEEYVILRHK